jgi:integrase/recombinase XerD
VKYNAYMLSKNVKVNSIAAYLRSIRAIYNKAIKQKMVDKASYPFDDFKLETEETASRSLSADILRQIFSVELKTDTPIWHYRNYFILSFCLIGMNFTDLMTLQPSHINNDTVHYQRDKTGKLYSIIVPDVAKKLLRYYKAYHSKNDHRYLLPALINTEDAVLRKKAVMQICKTCNKYMRKIVAMCGIDTHISTYYARYSWANLARELGYNKDLIAEALGHEYGNNETGIYLDKYDSQRINEANERILELIFKKREL